MVSSIATSPAVDLSSLPAPAVFDQLTFEERFTAMLTTLQGLWPEFSALVESDPVYKLLQSGAYTNMTLVQAFNDFARGNLLAFAAGAQLDHLGAFYDTPRLVLVPANPATGAAAVMESDSDFRERILLAPHSFSVAGPELAYVYHARRVADVRDASATSPLPGQVLISLLSRTGNGAAPAPTIAAVHAILFDEPVRPMGDEVIIQSAEIVNFTITAQLWLYAGPDANLIRDAALAALDSYLADANRLGRNVPRSALIAALHVAGVQRVELTAPLADQVMTATQVARANAINVTLGGIDE